MNQILGAKMLMMKATPLSRAPTTVVARQPILLVTILATGPEKNTSNRVNLVIYNVGEQK